MPPARDDERTVRDAGADELHAPPAAPAAPPAPAGPASSERSALAHAVAAAAHDVNNSLAAIVGLTQILLKHDSGSEERDSHEAIVDEARRIARLMRELVAIAREGEPYVGDSPQTEEIASHAGGRAVETPTAARERRDTPRVGHGRVARTGQAARPLDILVVDDEPMVRDLLTRCLTNRGHAVVPAVNAEEAVRLAERSTFDVVISDLRMPGMDGRELINRLRLLPACRATRFLLSSGDPTLTDASPSPVAPAGGLAGVRAIPAPDRTATPAPGALPPEITLVDKPYDVDTMLRLVESDE